MTAFKSRIQTASDGFKQNRKDMLALVEQLNGLNERTRILSEKRKARFQARGQLTPRERLSRLLDPGMPFLAVGNLSGYLSDGRPE
ncbi:MAG: acyl-CoA carboxylase subunit beta, partial [Henriciella sp.]